MTPSQIADPGRISVALVLLRIACGMAFFYHGSGILFGAFSGPGPAQLAASHHWPLAVSYLVGMAQVAGAVAVLTGVLFRFGAACLFVVMLGAIIMVHLPHGFDVNQGGVEYALTQLLITMAFMLTGPGRYSLAALFPVISQRIPSMLR